MTTTKRSKSDGFSEAERAAMRERAQELKAQGRSGQKKADNEQAVLDAISEMPAEDRALAERIHAIVTSKAPDVLPRTWYGMPAYANGNDKIVCFFKAASKFDGRYAVLGFEDAANLDESPMWPVVFAITKWSPAVEKKVTALVTTAFS
jgi:uncharacterized protein YdhG (YjbR/CyaY superfamily)